MTSPAKRVANRRNAAKSTGPKSRAGKARFALNAVTHGLSAQPSYDPAARQRIDDLALAFAGSARDDGHILALARAAAEAQIMVLRVKEAKRHAWHAARRDRSITERGDQVDARDLVKYAVILRQTKDRLYAVLADYGMFVYGLIERNRPWALELPFADDAEREAAIAALATQRLAKLVRYERRAVNRRDKALRALEQAKGERRCAR